MFAFCYKVSDIKFYWFCWFSSPKTYGEGWLLLCTCVITVWLGVCMCAVMDRHPTFCPEDRLKKHSITLPWISVTENGWMAENFKLKASPYVQTVCLHWSSKIGAYCIMPTCPGPAGGAKTLNVNLQTYRPLKLWSNRFRGRKRGRGSVKRRKGFNTVTWRHLVVWKQ